MQKQAIVGIDIGSTNIKTVVYDAELNMLAQAVKEIAMLHPRPGWTEYDPALWWEYVKDTSQRALREAGIVPGAVAGIGVSSLGCCTVPLDGRGHHLYHAIPWSDQRATAEVEYLERCCRDEIYAACGNIPTVLSATPHLMWLKKHEPDIYHRMHKYTEASGFIVQKLTGQFLLDYSMASALDYGFDTTRLEYDASLIEKMHLDIEKYPVPHDNRMAAGLLTEKAAQATGFVAGTPVYLGGLDIVTATVAVGAVSPGQGFCSMGSASNLMIVADSGVKSPYLTSLLHPMNPAMRLLFGSQPAIGFSFQWFSQQLCCQERQEAALLGPGTSVFEVMTRKASSVPPGSGGLVYLPYLFGKFHPVFNPAATGVFFGITATTTREEMMRAVMEGCTYNLHETIESARALGIQLDEIVASGGPAQSDLWCQIIADVTQAKVKTLHTSEASPLGNAIIAGLGEGVWDSYETVLGKLAKSHKCYSPNPNHHVRYRNLFGLYRQLYQDLQSAYAKLGELKASGILQG